MTIRKRLTHEAYQCLLVDQEKDRPLFSRAWTLQEELLAPSAIFRCPGSNIPASSDIRMSVCINPRRYRRMSLQINKTRIRRSLWEILYL